MLKFINYFLIIFFVKSLYLCIYSNKNRQFNYLVLDACMYTIKKRRIEYRTNTFKRFLVRYYERMAVKSKTWIDDK